MEPTEDGFKLGSGKEFYANRSILGLARGDDGRLSMTYGYDGGVAEDDGLNEFAENAPFTPEERMEILGHMIGLWTEWAKQPHPKRTEND